MNNLLESRPRRALPWREDGQGRAVLLRPRFGSGRLGKRLQTLLKSKDYRIRLDEIGTAVWRHCDGQTPVTRISQELRRQFGKKVEPAEDRVVAFVRQMMRARLIDFGSP